MRRGGWIVGILVFGIGCDEQSDGAYQDVFVIETDASSPKDMTLPRDVPSVSTPSDQMVRPDQGGDGGVDAQPDMFLQTACSDEIDNDSDDQIDYPLDPGCIDAQDDNELDPDALACEDLVDNDGDGLIDFPDDPGCSFGSDGNENNVCGSTYEYQDITGQFQVMGNTEGGQALFDVCRTNRAPERIFLFTLRSQVARLRIDTEGSDFDTLLGVWSSCDEPSSELACNDDALTGVRTSELILERPVLGDYYILVDGHGDSAGSFQLNIRGELPVGARCQQGRNTEEWISCGADAVCRRGTCQTAACSDGIDNDGDTFADYPNDPGCETASDDNEGFDGPPPQCFDGLDNDGDGRVDYPQDPDCSFAGDDDESRPAACQDGRDNDRDGLIDLDDPGCQGNPERNTEYNVPLCRNGFDDDQDGLIDFPDDPGCTERNGQDETDPDVPAQCHDGVDNDEDGLTDYPDDVESCLYAADDSEDDPCERMEPRDVTGLDRTRGNSQNNLNDFQGSCVRPSGNEDVLLWRVEEGRRLDNLILDTRDSDYDTHVYVRTACNSNAEIGCDDNSGTNFHARLELGPQEPGQTLLIFVDSRPGQSGIWRIRMRAELAAGSDCGGRRDYVCAPGLNCVEGPEGPRCTAALCNNQVDDDGDGLIDYPNDPGCADASDEDETDPDNPTACSNGVDDDGDGWEDFPEDPNCSSAADEFEGPDCADGLDNDNDNSIDFDRDNDGRAGPNRDLECVCPDDPSESEQPDCQDRCDNDSDGLIDLEDPGCLNDPERRSEFNLPQCRDGQDNDGDGRVDYPADPSCYFIDGPLEEGVDPMPACADAVDNDGDGLIDFPADNGCVAAADSDERPTCDSDIQFFPNAVSVEGTTARSFAQTQGACGFDAGSPEAIWRLRVPYPGLVNVTTAGSSFNTILYARSGCEPNTVCPEPEPDPEPVDAGPLPEPEDLGFPNEPMDLGPIDELDAQVSLDLGMVDDLGLSVDSGAILEDASVNADREMVDVGDAGLPENMTDAEIDADALATDSSIQTDVEPVTDGAPLSDSGNLVQAPDANVGSVDMDVEPGEGTVDAEAPIRDADNETDEPDQAIESEEAQPDENVPGNSDPGDEPCFPEPTQVACNDNSGGLQSAISFPWPGGDAFLFVDGFGRSFGQYILNVSVIYAAGSQCGPDMYEYAGCADGTTCLPNEAAGFPTCQ